MILATDEVFTYAIFNYVNIIWSSHTEAGGKLPDVFALYFIVWLGIGLWRTDHYRRMKRDKGPVN